MRIDIVTIFPEFFGVLDVSLLGVGLWTSSFGVNASLLATTS